MVYLKCKSCSGRYDLQPGELPGDFESCQCGGELEFYDDCGHKRLYKPINMHKTTEISPLMKVLIVLGVSFLIIQIVGTIIVGILSGLYNLNYHNYLIYIQIAFSLIIAFVCYLMIRK